MLGHAELESFINIDSHAPRVLDPDRIRRPGVERFGYGLAEQECRSAEYHKSAQHASPKRTRFQHSREHIACEQAARRIHSPVLPCVAGAQVWVNLVVRRRQIELPPSPKRIPGEKHSWFGCGSLRSTCRSARRGGSLRQA